MNSARDGSTGICVQSGPAFGEWSTCSADWDGRVVEPAVHYGFRLDEEGLFFRAKRAVDPVLHPEGQAGESQEELWNYEVAEFFLSHPENGSYLEVNLAPNGAWWTCLFRAPREPWTTGNVPLPGVRAHGRVEKAAWEAELFLPLAALEESPIGARGGWGLNATFVLDPPAFRYLTVCPLGSGDPDFHRPSAFCAMRLS